MRLGRVLPIVIAAGLVGAGLAGCGPKPADQGDPAAPILVRGQVVDAARHGLPGAGLSLIVMDVAHAQVGQPVPLLYSHDFTADANGWFELHVALDPGLSAAAAANGGWVNFQLQAFAGGSPVASYAFPRQVVGGTWNGAAPLVQIAPGGGTEIVPPADMASPPGAS